MAGLSDPERAVEIAEGLVRALRRRERRRADRLENGGAREPKEAGS
ncbi:MAG: hypothetical protein IIC90_09300 [Chloroflexi bacterium]|nr:hypothetical protein [Chloroflexota bacterium]